MNLALKIIKGPIDQIYLKAITDTYGEIDYRYKSMVFCDNIFNKNPLGYSLHGFIFDDEDIVGHYAIIPVFITRYNEVLLSGKGEALFLKEKYRTLTLNFNGSEIPAGWALIRAVNDSGLKNGMKVVHNYSPRDIGSFLRIIGFSKIDINREQYHFIFSTSILPEQYNKILFAVKFLSILQNVLLLLTDLFVNFGKSSLKINDREGFPVQEKLFRNSVDINAVRMWSVSRDDDTIRWMRNSDTIEFLSKDQNPKSFFVVKKGTSAEILWFSLDGEGFLSSIRLLCLLLKNCKKNGVEILSIDKKLLKSKTSLFIAAKILFFFPRRFLSSIYVKSEDKFFTKQENLNFTRLFNL